MSAEIWWEKEYHLDNGVIVRCGPLQISYREEGDKMVMRCDMQTSTIIPGMECDVLRASPQGK